MNGSDTYCKVTIMIPTYNQEEYVEQCVSSCLAQSYPNLEVVIGDDHSTDRTPELLAKFSRDPRVHIVRNETNLGRVANYHNLLYRHARGEWVLNLDGDDYLSSPEAISTLANAIPEASDSVLVFGTVHRLDDRQRAEADLPRRDVVAPPEVIHGTVLVRDYWKTDRGLRHAGALYHRRTALELGFYELDIISSDIDSLLRLSIHGSVIVVDAPIAIWRFHGHNESAQVSLDRRLANLKMIKNVHEELQRSCGRSFAKRWRKRMRRKMIYGSYVSLRRAGRADLARVFLMEATVSSRELLSILIYPKFFLRKLTGKW